jgi:CPA2 family monovalent cation:H+ antiporter-2
MFFVALGTLVNPADALNALPWLLAFLAMVVGGKVLVVWLLAKLVHLGARTLQLAVGLGQVGEFSYVLGALALGAGIITKEIGAGLIGAVVVSIAASSILVRLAGSPQPNNQPSGVVE